MSGKQFVQCSGSPQGSHYAIPTFQQTFGENAAQAGGCSGNEPGFDHDAPPVKKGESYKDQCYGVIIVATITNKLHEQVKISHQ